MCVIIENENFNGNACDFDRNDMEKVVTFYKFLISKMEAPSRAKAIYEMSPSGTLVAIDFSPLKWLD